MGGNQRIGAKSGSAWPRSCFDAVVNIDIDAPLAFGSRVNVAAILERWRLACKQTHVNCGAADKKHYSVYISQLDS